MYKKLTVLTCLLLLAATLATAQAGATAQGLRLQAGPVAQDLAPDSARIWWAGTGVTAIVYGTDRAKLTQRAEVQQGHHGNFVQLSGLQPDTVYSIALLGPDGRAADFFDFRTLAAKNPVRISDGPRIEYIDDKSAVIAWTTSTGSSAQVVYWTENGTKQTEQAPWGTGTHRVTLRNLRPATMYIFEVRSAEAQGTGATVASGKGSFTTARPGEQAFRTGSTGQQQAAAQPQQPQLQFEIGPVVQGLRDDRARVWWNGTGVTTVRYGTDRNNMNQTAQVQTGDQGQFIELSNLQPDTTYYVSFGEQAQQGPFEFKTLAANAKLEFTDGPVVEYVSHQTAVIAWSTTEPSSTRVVYWDNSGQKRTAQAPWGPGTHRVTLRGLKPDTVYNFEVFSGEAQGGGGATITAGRGQFQSRARGEAAFRNRQVRQAGPSQSGAGGSTQ